MPFFEDCDQPLPPNPFTSSDDLQLAYARSLELEESASQSQQSQSTLPHGRILGYMLLESSFSPVHQHTIAAEISLCKDQDALRELAEAYKKSFLMPFLCFRLNNPEANGNGTADAFYGPTEADGWSEPCPNAIPLESEHPFESNRARRLLHQSEMLVQTRRRAFERSRYRCMTSGCYDWLSKLRGIDFEVVNPPTGVCGIVPIIPPPLLVESVQGELEMFPDNPRFPNIFGLRSLYAELNLTGDDIYSLKNILALRVNHGCSFCQLSLWFEPCISDTGAESSASRQTLHSDQNQTPEPQFQEYTIHSIYNDFGMPEDFKATFTTSRSDLELPNPTLLRFHAMAAKVLNRSGPQMMLNDEAEARVEALAVLVESRRYKRPRVRAQPVRR